MAVTKNQEKINNITKTRSRVVSNQYRRMVLTRAAESLLGKRVDRVDYPGGKSRESIRLTMQDDTSVIATRRSNLTRARLEVRTLTSLNKHNAPVPRLLANNHSHVLIQEEVMGERLSSALKNANKEQYETLVAAALDSMASIHAAASQENLELFATKLGNQSQWIAGLVNRPAVIGEYLKVKAPELDLDSLITLLSVKQQRFIKWDSRPGNAIVEANGRIVWFDWEHAGTRNRLDDMAWILGDEFLPEFAETEASLIERFIPQFADAMSAKQAHDYLMAYGTFHMVVRLGLILKHMDGEWWDQDYCIDGDKIGVTLLCAQRLCERGGRWSGQCELTQPLASWFASIKLSLTSL